MSRGNVLVTGGAGFIGSHLVDRLIEFGFNVTVLDNLDPQVLGKRDHEEMFLVMGRSLGIPTAALRFFNAYGSRQALSNPYTGVAAIFISRLMNNQSLLLFEDGNTVTHIEDYEQGIAFTNITDMASKQFWRLKGEIDVSQDTFRFSLR